MTHSVTRPPSGAAGRVRLAGVRNLAGDPREGDPPPWSRKHLERYPPERG